MALYMGYYRPNAGYLHEQGEKARAGNAGVSPVFRQKVIELRDKLPSSIRLIGSYAPIGGTTENRPAVWLAETDDPAELAFINNWYEGFLDFEWAPAQAVGTTSAAATAVMEANADRR